ncbi:hypothetical protein Syun_006197 [Stephania yunnanensis]|uniref:Uncharacterized protein n=1 Tax=Stephania yunnanensis TaxID=152371 RepID=A0AAP0KWG7_9MAGN
MRGCSRGIGEDAGGSICTNLEARLMAAADKEVQLLDVLDLGMHSKYYCNGSIAECNEEHEMLMESEISHRLLAESQKTISYDVLKGDNAACGGKSCSGAQANKIYPRPCYKYKQCR